MTNSTPKPQSITSAGCKVAEYVQTHWVTLNCPQHGTYEGYALLRMATKVIMSLCPICEKNKMLKEKQRLQALSLQRKQKKIADLTEYSGIPERFKTRNFDNYRVGNPQQKTALRIVRGYADQFEHCLKTGGGLILAGKPGTGKTHLAAAVAHQIIQSGRSVFFISAIRALRKVKESYQRNTSKIPQQDIIDEFLLTDLLIIDEIGMQFGTETEKLIFFEILNGRYEAVLPSIIVSNLTESELSLYLGTRILDRLQEGGGAFVSFDWESYRKHAHLDADLPKACVKPVVWE